MIFGAGKVLQRGTERLGRDNAKIDLQSGIETHGHFRVAARDHIVDTRKLGQAIHGRAGVGRFDQDVEIANRFLPSPVAAGHFHLLDRVDRLHVCAEL